MSADGLRLVASGAVSRCRTRDCRRAWSLCGPLLLIALGVGMLAGSWVALLVQALR